MSDQLTYFTKLNIQMLEGARYAILPGDPKRAKQLAEYLDLNAKPIQNNRQHASYLATLKGQKVLVISTGMGCPAIHAVAVELSRLGVGYLIRIGTSGTIKEQINLGDLVFTRAAVKLDGISRQYIDEGFPAIASFSLTESFMDAAKAQSIPHYLGITASSDTFWPGQERHDNFSGYLLRNLRGAMDEWRALNVANFEMEASALLTVAYLLNIKAACFCGIIAKRIDSEKVSHDAKYIAQDHWERTLKAGLIVDMQKRGYIN